MYELVVALQLFHFLRACCKFRHKFGDIAGIAFITGYHHFVGARHFFLSI